MRLVVADTETHLIAPGMPCPKIVCLSTYEVGHEPELHAGPDAVAVFKRYASDASVRFVGHNFAYDLGVLCAEDPDLIPLVFDLYEQRRIYCTLTRQELIDLATGQMDTRWEHDERGGAERVKARRSLAACYRYYLGLDLPKGDTYRLRYHELDGVPLDQWPDEAIEYALMDTVATSAVYHAQQRHVQYLENQYEQFKSAWVLHLIRSWGVRADMGAVQKFGAEVGRKIEEYRAVLQSGCLCPVGVECSCGLPKPLMRPDGTRDQAAIRARAKAAGVERTTDGGEVSTARDVLFATEDPALHALGEYTKFDKLQGTYLPVLYQAAHVPLNTSYTNVRTTGRTSSYAPNLQNIPRDGDVRPCFVPRPGHVFIACDYASLEMRTLAQVCIDLFGYSTIADLLRTGKDPHIFLACVWLGLDYDTATVRYKEGDTDVADARQLAKAANYGLSGAMGPERFAAEASKAGADIDLPTARMVHAAYYRAYPEMQQYRDVLKRELSENPTHVLFRQHRSGRYRRIDRVFNPERPRSDNRFTELANTKFQGLAADGFKAALWLLSRHCYVDRANPLYGSRIVLCPHDEVIVEVPEAQTHEAARQIEADMIEGMCKYTPDVPIEAEAAAMRRWYKGAKAVRVEGRLVPSRPETDANGRTKWVADVSR